MSELRRQQALVEAIVARRSLEEVGFDLSLGEAGQRAERGLNAYRANARMHIERALSMALPTVRAMMGEAAFSSMAWAYALADPPRHGDLGHWGDGLPAFLDDQVGDGSLACLSDCARLDLAVHHIERAADASFDAASLSLLGTDEPTRLWLEMMPGVCVCVSAWPIGRIHAAYRLEGSARDAVLEAVGAPGARPEGESVLVVREGWRGVPSLLGAQEVGFTQAVLAGQSLGAALEQADAGFDFSDWLARACRGPWLKAVRRFSD